MDGVRQRLKDSLQFRLSLSLSLVILAVASIAGAFSVVSAYGEAHAMQDDMLRQVASLAGTQHLSPDHPLALTAARPDDSGEESRVIVQRLVDGTPIAGDVDAGAPLPLASTLSDGMHAVTTGGEDFQVLVRTSASGERLAVAQEIGVRDAVAWRSALRTLLPLLLLVPVLLVAVADLIRKTFRPIAALSAELEQRAGQQLHAVDDSQLPAEIRPFVMAINHLLQRVGAAMDAQRRFVADAAHELRTPLTALSLQAEQLAAAADPRQAHEHLASLRRGIQRNRTLLDQLLAMARAQVPAGPLEAPVSVLAVLRRVLEDLMPLAEQRHVDFAVEAAGDVGLMVSEVDLHMVLRNLLDNAVRHAPEHSRVELVVSTRADRVRLEVRDLGPGIPVEEREQVFGPFHRSVGAHQDGAGLGLSIVRAIAQRTGALVRLRYTDEALARGLSVSIEFCVNPALQLRPILP